MRGGNSPFDWRWHLFGDRCLLDYLSGKELLEHLIALNFCENLLQALMLTAEDLHGLVEVLRDLVDLS